MAETSLLVVAENYGISCIIITKKKSLTRSLDFEYQNEPSVLRNEPAVLRIQKKLLKFFKHKKSHLIKSVANKRGM